jgi:diacylglycerol kinase (ATP)
MPRKVHVVINPAAGEAQPILHILNKVFQAAGAECDISVTKASGDAERFARQAVESGFDVVAAYGGDGTVMEVARGLFGTSVPLAILPGGTANMMSIELGIPGKLEEAAEIAADANSPTRWVDAGMVNEKTFLLRVGVGFEARTVANADRQMKDRWSWLAYIISGAKALKDSPKVEYHLTFDNQEFELETTTCQVCNAGIMGTPGVTPVKNINISDGLLDLIVLRESALTALISQVSSFVENAAEDDLFHHWQAKSITIDATPSQPVHVDGEAGWKTPLEIKVMPRAVRVLIAKSAGETQ